MVPGSCWVGYTIVWMVLPRPGRREQEGSILGVLSLEASIRTPRRMGRRQLDEGTGSSRENLDTDAGAATQREGTHPSGV